VPDATRDIDLSSELDMLSRSLVVHFQELQHIDVDKVLFTFSRSRRQGRGGLLARITPLRGKAGSRQLERHRGRFLETWEYPQFIHEGREIFYLITLLMPRFLHLEPHERLATLLHELWHISPSCDGDIRRYPGPRYAHGERGHGYDAQVDELTRSYLESNPELPLLLTLPAEAWQKGDCRVRGLRIRKPRARLIARRKAPPQTL